MALIFSTILKQGGRHGNLNHYHGVSNRRILRPSETIENHAIKYQKVNVNQTVKKQL